MLIFIALFSFSTAQAHDLRQGQFDTSAIRPDVIEFVQDRSASKAPDRIQSAEELALQKWVVEFTGTPANLPFFEGLKFKSWIVEKGYANANASVAADGQINVTRSLLDLFEATPQYTKAILAHELAHVARQHSLRLTAKTIGKETLEKAMAPTAQCSTFEACRRAFTAVDNLTAQRKFEYEADQFALELLDNAGMDPALFPLALQALEDSHKAVGNGEFFRRRGVAETAMKIGMETIAKACSTHPETCDRVSGAFKEIAEHRYVNAWTEVPKPRPALIEWLAELTKLR